ncbi:hypothetical protein ABZV80_03955 [Streptomyces sp. NPDC005132]|uniref:hypothetical protein n=1 Tax=Streptomyces sp. NPDC005132 TaxID=3154294 RepID=UPI0033B8B32D
MLQAAEAAPPVESLDVVARILKDRLEAVAVSFLIADFTGSSVARLGTEGSVEAGELAQRIPLADTAYDDVIRTPRPGIDNVVRAQWRGSWLR